MRSIIRPDVHPIEWDASKSRNGAVHPMIEFFLYITHLYCNADAIMLRMRINDNLSNELRIELLRP